jgi:hypothetical protein
MTHGRAYRTIDAVNVRSLARSSLAPQHALTRISFLAAPMLILVYGVVRLIGGLYGSHGGPGLVWTAGHALFLAGLVLFGAVLFGLRGLLSGTTRAHRLAADVTIVVACVGLIAFVRVAVIDLVVGLRAADPTAMSRLLGQFEDFPGVLPAAFYQVGPLLFQVGLFLLLTRLALLRPRRLPRWSPVLFLLGAVLIGIDLDLLPLGAALFWLALAPAAFACSPAAP